MEQLVVTLPLLDLGDQPGIVPRFDRHILHNGQPVEIVEAALEELVLTFGDPRRRCDHLAAAQHINRSPNPRPDLSPLAVMSVPSLKVAAAAADNDSCLTVTV